VARILAYTTPAKGHLFPLVPILDELHRRGHQIVLRTLGSQVSLMRERGFEVAAVSEQIEEIEHDDWRAANPRAALARSVGVFCARAEYDAPDLQQAIATERPDAVIVDINSWGGLSAAEAWSGPWATYCPYPLPLRSPDAPPFGPGLPPARGSLGRMRDRLLRPLVLGTIEKTMTPALNDIRSWMGLPPLSVLDALFRRPPLLLYMTAEPFEYPRRDWPESVVMVGPCAWDPPAEMPAWLAEVTQPLVLVTTSSEFQGDGRLIQTAFDALADESVTVLATLPAGDPARFHVSANARLERFVPHNASLDRAVCVITHGGMGATQKALARGIPVCAVPFGRDQLEVARRVEVAGAGTRLPAGRLRPDRLLAKVREAMTKSDGAKRVAQSFAAAGGPMAAVDAFETRLLMTKPSAL